MDTTAKTQRSIATKAAMALAIMALALFAVITPAMAQDDADLPADAPEGAECAYFDVDPPAAEVAVPGDHDLTVILLEDGSEVSFEHTTDGQVVSSPSDSPIVGMWKCSVPEQPEPTPEETPEETATPEETPEEETSAGGATAQEGEEAEALAQTGSESGTLFVWGVGLILGGAMVATSALNARRRLN